MNLSEALNVALPDLPAQRLKNRFPQLDPNLIIREDVQDGNPILVVYQRRTANLYRFSPEQWTVVQAFDGNKSYKEIAEELSPGGEITEKMIREFADGLAENDFWHKTAMEANIALSQKLAEERQKRVKKKSKHGDISHMYFSGWDPDRYLTWLDGKIGRIVYSGWFTTLVFCLFAFTAFVFINNWGEIGRDTLKYYTFTEKGFVDLAEFWVLFLVLGFFHESAHGLTCKHYGGGVHSMGFMLIYLSPAFFVDVTETYVSAEHWQRLATIMAGIYVELIACSLATVYWWGSAPGTFLHELAYKVMLITGVAVVVMNLNPLIKLDGYYALSELLGIPDLKEKSTSFVSTWVQKHIWHLPVEVEPLPEKRRRIFAVYAIISGTYSYLLLFAVTRFAYNVFHKYTVDWAFLPALALGLLIFRSRIRTLVRFMKTVYLDKKEWLKAMATPRRMATAGAVLFVLLILPVWRDSVDGRFLLEPAQRAVLRAEVDGTVLEVGADEGQKVSAGETIARMQNLQLASDAAQARSDFQVAAARAIEAQLRYADLGPAEQQRQQLLTKSQMLSDQVNKLNVVSPIAGVVMTPRVQNLVGSHLTAGTPIAEVADMGTMRARIYVPEEDMRDLRRANVGGGNRVLLHVDGTFGSREAVVQAIAPVSSEMPVGLEHVEQYKGIRPPGYYVADALLRNPDLRLESGAAGTAKILVGHRSILGFLLRDMGDFLGRKVW